jgi:hypothetical protein
VLTVKRPILQLGGKLHEEPTAKSWAGDRLVFLDAETAQLLREHHRAQLRARMKAGPGARSRELVMGESCQVKPGGAGGARTHDRRIMRSPAWRSWRATCMGTTESCRRWP